MQRTVVWFSEIPWDFLVQRHHHLLENLSSDWKIIFLEPLSRYRFRLRHIRQKNIVAAPILSNGPLLDIPIVGLLCRLINRLYVPLLLRLYGVKKGRFIAVTSNVFVLGLIQRIKPSSIVFDCHDDQAAFPHLPKSTGKFFDETVACADLVMCSSTSLHSQTRLSGKNEASVLIGNGVSRIFVETARTFWRVRRPHPSAIGFIGVLSEWVDYDLLAKVAAYFANTELLIVGPVVKRCEPEIGRLKEYPNVSLTGLVPYHSLPYYLCRLKVGLIPFKICRLTFSVNPNKLYEYASFGIQIVSTDFSPDVQKLAGSVRVADNQDEFLAHVEKALLTRNSFDPDIVKIAEVNYWEDKAAKMEAALDQLANHTWTTRTARSSSRSL